VRKVTALDDVIAAGHRLEVDDRFDGPDLDRNLWLPSYLPQWAGRSRSAARFDLVGGRLHLRIDADQPAWAPELDGPMRVSSLQTGVYAGPLGSTIGQHRVHPEAVVVEEQTPLRLHTPRYGAFVLTAAWDPRPDQMVAFWMIGYEDEPQRSGEICICEIFGDEAGPDAALIGMGLHPFGDPELVDDFDKVHVPIDVRDMHEYAAVWTPHDVTFHVDGEPVKHVDQSPGYEMQFMLGIYDFGRQRPRQPSAPFVVDRVRSFAPRPAGHVP
jgi:hypothetical protein